MVTAIELAAAFNAGMGQRYAVRLCGGAEEPFYKAASESTPYATIVYRADYLRSALHELAHWCIAGTVRRGLDDYGYWYEADGRSFEQQLAFMRVEAKPQALESIFCRVLGIPFQVSLDNLENGFTRAVTQQFADQVSDEVLRLRAIVWPQRWLELQELLLQLAESYSAFHENQCHTQRA